MQFSSSSSQVAFDRALSLASKNPAAADWSAYARVYDLLARHNPAYQELLRKFEAFLTRIEEPRSIYDIGAGTGNYTEIAARIWPRSEIRLFEPDAEMMRFARVKLRNFDNVSFDTLQLQQINIAGSADLVICVHALYSMPEPAERLFDMRRLLRPGGRLFLVDLGRNMDTADWRRFIYKNLKDAHGFAGALKILFQGREIAKQNTVIQRLQNRGIYWTHSATEIAMAVEAAGFKILRQESTYRGYSDLLECRVES